MYVTNLNRAFLGNAAVFLPRGVDDGRSFLLHLLQILDGEGEQNLKLAFSHLVAVQLKSLTVERKLIVLRATRGI